MTSSPPVSWPALIESPDTQALIELSLREDIGDGDVTSEAIFAPDIRATAVIAARQPTVVCGLPLAEHLFKRLDPDAIISESLDEGSTAQAGQAIMRIESNLRALLTAERTVLNFLMRLSGIATAAQQAQAAVPTGCHTKIYDTRKTTPGWRGLEKAAVATGGAHNHRFGLFDAVLIKDNHVAEVGSVGEAVRRCRAQVGTKMIVQVEIDHLEQLEEALVAGPDIVLLDNLSCELMRQAVEQTRGRAELEASGGIRIERIPEIARTGVDRISMGALTHTVMPADLGLDMEVHP
jgi:nicotinate-nucleotide pyrophosphorylase (carboxylating)